MLHAHSWFTQPTMHPNLCLSFLSMPDWKDKIQELRDGKKESCMHPIPNL